jgi:twitching motility protein PilT
MLDATARDPSAARTTARTEPLHSAATRGEPRMNALTSEDSFPTRASLRRAARPVTVPVTVPVPLDMDIETTIPPIPPYLAPRAAASTLDQRLAMFGLNVDGSIAQPSALSIAHPAAHPDAQPVGQPAAQSVAQVVAHYSDQPVALPAARPAFVPVSAERLPRAVVLDVGLREPIVAVEASAELNVGDVAVLATATSTVPDGADEDLLRALMQVIEVGGSDLHITGNAGPTLRVDGRLRQVDGTAVWSREKVRAALLSMLTAEQQENFSQVLELDIALTLPSGARFRVNLYQQRGAIGGAFRLVPTRILPLEELGIPDSIGKFAALPRGLVLVTGPTGSGKSTTLAALIDLVNRTRADHIVTVEDPIEFLHSNKKSLVNQREVGTDTHSFAAALKHVLRQDPDVILIGELRDLETISVALTAAETGHLVFATLHTQDAAQSIDRLIDVFPPFQQAQVRAQLAATLQGVVCQMLLRRSSGEGRVVATEVLVTTPAIANLIREGRTHQIRSAMQAGRQLGMHTADQRLAELVNLGTITHAAAYEKAQDIAGLRQLIQREEPAGSGPPLAAGGVDFGDSYSAVGPTR